MSEFDFRQLIGVEPRSGRVPLEAWGEIEAWAGRKLPVDFKGFVELYGGGLIRGHLFVPHPCDEESLLEFMKSGRRAFEKIFRYFSDDLGGEDFDPGSVVPWAYSNWDGDQCFFVPAEGSSWRILLVFRQLVSVQFYDAGFSELVAGVIAGTAVPPGWPNMEPAWRPIDTAP
ncbi:hypothetical protein ACFWP2_11230 [Kitasatospora sp. NPDC058444]|uniref:hypothetical protein n=1 Tax=Kitasatospora sp. NPDC058444 TaxID=3346504 RepID=UPI003657AD26